MAVDNTDIQSIFKMYMDESFTKILEVQKETQMEDEALSNTMSQALTVSLQGSIKTLEVYKNNELVEKRKALADKDILLKDKDILLKDKDILLKDKQLGKLDAEIAFTNTQKDELIASVSWNNKIKSLDSYADMIGTMGAGGLKITTSMWTYFFNMVSNLHNGINSQTGLTNPSDTTITKAT